MRILLIILFIIILSFSSNAVEEEYKLPNIQPKDLVNNGYKLHSVIPIESEGPRIMLYTFTKDKKIVSCVVELDAMFADGHICYNVTN